MEMNHLKYFYEVARQRSFTGASRSLRVSQPAISRMVRSLEDSLGVRLLDRDRRGVRLTDIGERWFDRCTEIFREVGNLQQMAQDYQRECSGDLRIGASDNICNYLLPEVIRDFCGEYPKVNFKVFSGTSPDIKEGLLGEELELGLFYTALDREDRRVLIAEQIGFAEFVLVVSGRNRVAGKRFDPRDLGKGLRYIGSRRADYRRQYPALKMHQVLGIEPEVFIETNNQETQKQLVLRDIGYSIVPLHMVRQEVAERRLRIVPTPKKLGSPIFLVRRRNRLLSKQGEVFAEFLKREWANSTGK